MLEGNCANKYTTKFITGRHQNLRTTCWLKCPRHTFYGSLLCLLYPWSPSPCTLRHFSSGLSPKASLARILRPPSCWLGCSLQGKNAGAMWTSEIVLSLKKDFQCLSYNFESTQLKITFNKASLARILRLRPPSCWPLCFSTWRVYNKRIPGVDELLKILTLWFCPKF